MASTFSTFRAKVAARLQDAAGKLAVDALDAAILGALGEFQQARPRAIAALVTGAGTFDYALDGVTPAFAGWVDGLSAIQEVIYPWSASAREPSVLSEDVYRVIRLSSGLFLRFIVGTPTAPEQFHVSFTGAHTLTESASSILAADEETFSDLATAYACEALAGYYTQAVDPTLQADTVDRRTQGDQYRAQAKRWRDAYTAKMGGGDASTPVAGVSSAASVFGSAGGSGYFFHGGR